jgi:preprotein translocase subunit SecA
VIKDVNENNTHFENIAIPLTDGIKTLQVIVNLKKAYEEKGHEVVQSVEKGLSLALIDDAWKEHLREMDDLKQSVQSATYEQKDPLLIYKFESFELFKTMLQRINKDVCSFLMKGALPGMQPNIHEARAPRPVDLSKLKTGRDDSYAQANRTSEPQRPQPVKVEKKVGRNDPCPCGSGKKYKQCHGRGAE